MKTRLLLLLLALVATAAIACGPTSPIPSATETELEVAASNTDSSLAEEVAPAPEATNEGNADTADTQLVVAESTAASNGQLAMGRLDSGHYYMGDINAPVIIEEFSDFQCPFCARFNADTFSIIKQEAIANGEAMVVFYDFPLSFHPQGLPAANAARCAGDQGAEYFWAMHDLLFAQTAQWSNDQPNDVFKSYAAELQLDQAAFDDCVDTNAHLETIQADMALGQQRGVSGTPTFFLNEQPLVGAVPVADFRQALAKVAAGESIAAPPPAVPDDVEIPPFEMPEPAVLAVSTVPTLGQADAPITIVEFSDYQCPFCNRHVSETMPTLMAEMIETGRVRYEFKDFPLDNIHPEARSAAEAARCAAEQSETSYWAMHDALFTNQSAWSGQGANASTIYAQLATEIGLDGAQISECVTSGRYASAVQADVDEGFALGVSGTPAFYINGYFISGAQPYELFDTVVSAIETDELESLFRRAYDSQVAAYLQQLQQQQAQQQAPQAPAGPTAPIEVPTNESPSVGDPNAPITIVEYTDFQCPFCGRHFAETFPLIQENYVDKGLVRYVFKDFPLSNHPQAPKAAEAARCAHEQGQFLAMHHILFERQGDWSGRNDAPTFFSGYAAELGLDMATFDECLNSGQYAEAVQADLQEGLSVGVTGTPSFVVNGQLVVGALPYATFDQALQSLLEE
ncbi:MAG: DsbA family protein [Chloroflexi bacterium]|nr:DsbA family protein [Chloroflexota bacterium]